ncbi:ion transporter [Rhizobacter sp. J219]|uniref:ion transporter n=1 Tax=Rhizobacter sp. J219 TaxID=2898430 RepID=UPI0021519C38|nr:ion transporter [Rhizobacter sp. J219]MCR5881373.1 ion transporter [Rhizobacter sp. J219]
MRSALTPPAPRDSAEAELHPFGRPAGGVRQRLYRVIFESDTRAGKLFDEVLIGLILASVAVVVLDSIASIHAKYGGLFTVLEWSFTLIFTLEYVARLICVQRPLRYARSVFGVIDLVAVLPTYLAILVPGLHALIDVRVLRLLRIFRIFKLSAYIAEYGALGRALYESRRKILVFLSFVLLVVLIMGTLMYVVEGPQHGFHNIPTGVYWAITTMTTVGFGDITPKTDLGRFIASLMMLLGWGTLAVPTGIVSAEFTAQKLRPRTRHCVACGSDGHSMSDRFCRDCGAALPPVAPLPAAR